jgi:outer membrane protein OmpA-like peptidoglycan-associated protein
MFIHPASARLIVAALCCALLGTLLAGCGSLPSAPRTADSPGAPPAAERPSWVVEQRWLHQWFRGTPVKIHSQREELLTVEVPLDFCFDDGRANVKPPLAAVLDRLAASLRREDSARVHVAAASDPRGSKALALRRATAVRSYLVARGVQPYRFTAVQAADRPLVELRLELPPPAVSRSETDGLRPPAAS